MNVTRQVLESSAIAKATDWYTIKIINVERTAVSDFNGSRQHAALSNIVEAYCPAYLTVSNTGMLSI